MDVHSRYWFFVAVPPPLPIPRGLENYIPYCTVLYCTVLHLHTRAPVLSLSCLGPVSEICPGSMYFMMLVFEKCDVWVSFEVDIMSSMSLTRLFYASRKGSKRKPKDCLAGLVWSGLAQQWL